MTFLVASREESGAPINVYSPRSPLGAAINGKKRGEKGTYPLPNGRTSTVEIMKAVPRRPPGRLVSAHGHQRGCLLWSWAGVG